MKWDTPPQTFWPGIWKLLRDCLWAGTHLAILSPDGLSILIVLIKIMMGHGLFTVSSCHPGCLSILAMISNVAPLFCPGKYWSMCNFYNSLLHTNKNPLPLPCILCGVSNALTILSTQKYVQKFQNASMNSNGGVYCSDLLLMQFLQLHVQHMQIMALHHDIMLYLMVSMPENYF